MANKKTTVLVFVGPYGSVKSTVTSMIKPQVLRFSLLNVFRENTQRIYIKFSVFFKNSIDKMPSQGV